MVAHHLLLSLALERDGVERHRYVPLADAEETADADHQRNCLPVPVEEHVLDLADLVVSRIVDALLVPVRDRFRVRRQSRQDLDRSRRSRGAWRLYLGFARWRSWKRARARRTGLSTIRPAFAAARTQRGAYC